jgi:hypothetical protein
VPLPSALLEQPQGSLNYPGHWRASTYIGGSPGREDPAADTTVLINELMANTLGSDPEHPGQETDDWVELYNPSGSTVSLAQWYLSDEVGRPGKWALPVVSLPAQGRVVIPLTDFGLSKDGEELLLSHLPGSGRDRVVDSVSFKAQEPAVSLGRCPDGAAYWFRLAPSPGVANAGPVLDVMMAELMYHPVEPNEEYVELYNPLTQAVELGTAQVHWRLDGAVNYDFPDGVSLPAGGRLVVVGFDPAVETSRLGAFIAAYRTGPVAAGVQIVGPWSGNLSNRGERLSLEKSQPSDDPNDLTAWVVVDEALYSDVSPWPAGPDGAGAALQRVPLDQSHSGNDPANWQAATPSPGKP